MKIALLADHPEAIPLIAEWYFSTWGHKEAGNTEAGTRARLGTKLNRDALPLPIVAVEEKEILGTAQLKRHEMDIFPDREFWLGSLFVADRARGNGLGKLLVLEVIRLARIHGAQKLWLQTEKTDGGMYTALGWKVTEQLVYHGKLVSVAALDLF